MVNPLCSLRCVPRMSSPCHTSAVLVVFMALAVGVGTEPSKEQSCDVVGDESSESQMEKALLKKLEPLSQMRFNATVEISETENYTYQFRVCRQVNDSSHDFAGLIQRDRKTGKTTVVGRINETQVFNGSDWIMLIYKGGDSYGTHCSGEKRRAVIMISCKRGVMASSFSIVSEEREKEQDCFYLFEMDSSVACPAEDSHLSVGSILLITTAATLSVDLSPETHRLRTVVWAMTSWVRSPKNGMTTCYPCDGLSTPNSPPQRLVNRMLPSQFFSHFWFSFYDLLLLPLVCQISWMPLCVNSTGP
uniref:Cation-dependent mannose-6-phosphate receptor n=1 Tax=Anas platyrhynchos platyrhynchos TaxID=8840 RepID=A0A493TDE9_ANAPP